MNFEIGISIIIILIGVYGVATSKNIIKSILCFNIVQASIILLFVIVGSYEGDEIPILTNFTSSMVDPLPHALMITAIVISASITALSLMFAVKIFHYYGTLNWNELSKRM